jgi:hypothetical protein
MSKLEYFEEALAASFDELGISISPEHLKAVAKNMETANDNMSMAFPVPESPYPAEIRKLEKGLAAEKSKVQCQECKGSGQYVSHGPHHGAYGRCWKCDGHGRHLP